jgi:hypothetical protein
VKADAPARFALALREGAELLGNEALSGLSREERLGLDVKAFSGQLLNYMFCLVFILYLEDRPACRCPAPRGALDFDGGPAHRLLLCVFGLVYSHCGAALFHPREVSILARADVRDEVLLPVVRGVLDALRAWGPRVAELGNVLETTMAFEGFIAGERMMEVKEAGKKHRPESPGRFVPASEPWEDKYKAAWEGGLCTYEPGEFVFRKASPEQDRSGSFYTPECLAQCLVKYGIKAADVGTSDGVLAMRVMEPAMGSGAILAEAATQLAERYLALRQEELGGRIPDGMYLEELDRAKARITNECLYGIDTNPMAVRVAGMVLWLNCICREPPYRGRGDDGHGGRLAADAALEGLGAAGSAGDDNAGLHGLPLAQGQGGGRGGVQND